MRWVVDMPIADDGSGPDRLNYVGRSDRLVLNERSKTVSIHLRPIERRVLAMRDSGMDDAEIGRRIRKSPQRVSAIAEWAALPGRGVARSQDGVLSPLQTRVVAMRAEGQSHAEIGRRLRRGEHFVRQVEGLAHFRQYLDLLG
jgi:DNA-binding CsgD family transcriptional regulator